MPPDTTTEVISMIAVPRAIDTSSTTFSISVFLAPQLSGGDGTLPTDFVNWPDTLAAYAAGDSDYQRAYWDVLLTDSEGNTLYEHEVYLDASGTNAALWGSLFPPGTTFEDSGSDQQALRARQQSSSGNDFSAIPIISYPVKQISDFMTGQYQQYSPTEVPDLQTVASVYAPVTAGLIGVSGQEHQDALARERQARSRGGTVPHANDLTNASISTAVAAHDDYQNGDTNPPPPGVGTVDFQAALTYIGQHGVLQRALGLVFDLEVPYYNDPTLNGPVFGGDTLNSDVYLSVYLYAYPTADAPAQSVNVKYGSAVSLASGRFGFSQVSPRTQCDADSTTFSAHSRSGGIVGGVLLGGNPELVHVPPLDVDAAANAASSFARAIATATSPKKETAMAVSARSAATEASDDSDASSPTPPPSLQSGGLSLAKINAGFDLSTQIDQAYVHLYQADYAVMNNDPSRLEDFWAEDLVRGYVLDVYDAAYGVWCSTCERNVTYTSNTSGPVTVSGPTSEPFDEAPVQAVPRLVRTPRGKTEVLLALNEIMLSYKGWSNAVPRPGKPLNDDDYALPQNDPTPQFNLTITESVPDGRLPPLRFGHSYSMRARVIDVANNKPPTVDPDDDTINTPARLYGRLEPIPSPDLFPQSLPRPSESLKRMVIRDIDVATPSVRAMYPQRVSEPFAEAHGMFDSQDVPQSSAYGTIVPRESGTYPDPPTDATTQPPTIPLDQPVPYLPDPLVRGAALTFTAHSGAQAVANVDFSPQNGASWPDYRPFGIEVVAGSALTTSIDTNRRVITFTLTPADDVTVTLSATCDPGDVPLLGMPQLFSVSPPDAATVASGACWAVTPSINLELVYAVQKPLATPEFHNLVVERQPGQLDAYVYGALAWSPRSTAEVDIVAAWSEPVDDPAQDQLQGPGTPNPALRDTSNSPVATVSEGNLLQAGGGSEIQPPAGDELNETDPLSFKHLFPDTKHRVVTYSGVASTRFAECYPDGTPETVSTANPVTVSIPSSAQPEPPSITGVVPIYDWGSTDAGGKIVSERGPSGLRVFLARPWWTSGIGELLGVLTSAAAEGVDAFPIAADSGVSDWAADPVFASHPLPSRHPRGSSFPAAVRFGAISNQPLKVAGHEVAFDATRDTWYCDIKIDTGAAYTPMVMLALARWQPDSVSGLELSKVVMTQIMSLEPGRMLTVVRGGGSSLSSVQLTGYSYTAAGRIRSRGIAQVQVERRDGAIDDDELGWQLVGEPIQMSLSLRGAFTVWTARGVQLSGSGQHRLVVTQYELLPTDNRTELGQPDDFTYTLPDPGREYRLVHQDIVPL